MWMTLAVKRMWVERASEGTELVVKGMELAENRMMTNRDHTCKCEFGLCEFGVMFFIDDTFVRKRYVIQQR
jgi:hypothetical protein